MMKKKNPKCLQQVAGRHAIPICKTKLVSPNKRENNDVFIDDYMTDEKEELQTSTKKRWETRDNELRDEIKRAKIPPTQDQNEFKK